VKKKQIAISLGAILLAVVGFLVIKFLSTTKIEDAKVSGNYLGECK